MSGETLRAHLETIRDAYPPIIGNHGRIAHEHAVAALALLTAGKERYLSAGSWKALDTGFIMEGNPDPASPGDTEPGYRKPPGVRLWDGQTEELE